MKIMMPPHSTNCFPLPTTPNDRQTQQGPSYSDDLKDPSKLPYGGDGPFEVPDSPLDHLIPCAGTQDACNPSGPGSLFNLKG